MDCIVCGVTKSQTRLNDFHFSHMAKRVETVGFTLSSAGNFGVKELKHELREGASCSQQRQGNRAWTHLLIRNNKNKSTNRWLSRHGH